MEADRPHVSLDNVYIENVHQFVYLGSCFQSDVDSMADVKHRINLAQSTFSELHQLWRDASTANITENTVIQICRVLLINPRILSMGNG